MNLAIFNLLGGLALFLYGLYTLSEGFKNVFFKSLKDVLKSLTSNPVKAVGLGAFITSVIQSSSITIVTLIGFLNAGLMNLGQAIGVMLGAEIGTTITAQVVAFKIGLYYFPFIILGCLLFFFFKKKKIQVIGQIMIGFGILFLGMQTMSQGARVIQEIPFFLNMLDSFSNIAILGVLAGAIFTAVIQSSSATTGLVIAMGMEGVLALPAAIAIILGANIGTCITGLLASMKSCKSSKRLAIAHFLVNTLGVLVFVLLIPAFSRVVALTSINLGRQIANAHTIFNVLIVLGILPVLGVFRNLVEKIVPGEITEVERGVKFLEYKILHIPSLAISQAQKEVLRMAWITKDMLEKSQKTMFTGDSDLIKVIENEEDSVDELHHILDDYLTKISSQGISREESQKLAILIHAVTDIERIADHANNLAEISEFKVKNKIKFSSSAEKELNLMLSKAIESFSYSIKALENNNQEIAQKTLFLEKEVGKLEGQLRKSHYERLKNGICQPQAGPIYLEIIMNLKRVSDHSENIASGVIMGF
jgi:phosphate:Na+ symporter